MKTKMITITKEQEQWVQDNDIKLSQFVQKRIIERMNKSFHTK